MKWKRYVLCICSGIVLFLLAEVSDSQINSVEKGILYRNSCGKGEAVYEFYVEGVGENREKISLTVPEQKMSEEQFVASIPDIMELICERMLGENESLSMVQDDLNLIADIPEYGISVEWRSQKPEIISRIGTVESDKVSEYGENVMLEATLINGISSEIVEILVVVYPAQKTQIEQFVGALEQLVIQNERDSTIALPAEYEKRQVVYRSASHSQNFALIFLGIVAAGCLWLKERNDREKEQKDRESSLMMDYQDLVSGFLILTGAGYPTKAAWKKLTKDMEDAGTSPVRPLLREMRTAVNQMDTGMPETQAYAAFGRRCGVRCYVRFASLLESSVNTGGKNLRKLLETEMEEAFKQRADMARQKGEEASSKLLLPLFGMLGVVMVMVVAPAFLSLY